MNENLKRILYPIIWIMIGGAIVFVAMMYAPQLSTKIIEPRTSSRTEETPSTPVVEIIEESGAVTPMATEATPSTPVVEIIEESGAVTPMATEPAAPTPMVVVVTATPTLTAVVVQDSPASCLEPYDVDRITGKPSGFWVRISTETCAFGHRTFPQFFNMICPQGDHIGDFVCTVDSMGDIVVYEGINQRVAKAWGATVRYMPAYPGENVCTVWHNEMADGQRRENPFQVRFQPVPGGTQFCPEGQ